LDTLIDPTLFVGRSPQQVDEFLADEINPVLEANKDLLTQESVDSVNV
jgi:adenylosuccinate lyase